MKENEIVLHRAEIIWVVKTMEDPNYDFCESFYENEAYVVIILKKNSGTRNFDSDSNVIEVDTEKDFMVAIFKAIEEEKIVVAYLENVKEDYISHMQFKFFHIIPDTQICEMAFRIEDMEGNPL